MYSLYNNVIHGAISISLAFFFLKKKTILASDSLALVVSFKQNVLSNPKEVNIFFSK